jgi:non-ribosomal peptide synthetase component F
MNTTEKNFDEIILPDLFAEQVSKTPDAIALIDYNDDNNKDVVELTYRQVDEITDQLAVKLVEEYNVRLLLVYYYQDVHNMYWHMLRF